jgi:acyl carrier protein
MKSFGSEVRTVMAHVLGFDEEEIVPDALLADDLGLDAFDLIELATALESAFDVELDWRDLGATRNVADVQEHLEVLRALREGEHAAPGRRVMAGRRRPRLREARVRCANESALRRALSRLLEQDGLDDCLVDVPARLIHVRSVEAKPPQAR